MTISERFDATHLSICLYQPLHPKQNCKNRPPISEQSEATRSINVALCRKYVYISLYTHRKSAKLPITKARRNLSRISKTLVNFKMCVNFSEHTHVNFAITMSLSAIHGTSVVTSRTVCAIWWQRLLDIVWSRRNETKRSKNTDTNWSNASG